MLRQTSGKNLHATAFFILIPIADYEKFIQKNTSLVKREFIERKRAYDNGVEIRSEQDCFIEIRKGDTRRSLYVFSEYSQKLWYLETPSDANNIFSTELSECNTKRAESNEACKRLSVDIAQEDLETRWLTVPIVSRYSYSEFFELAFSSDTPTDQAAKYEKILKQAVKKYPNNKNIEFTCPVLPAKGRITFQIPTNEK